MTFMSPLFTCCSMNVIACFVATCVGNNSFVILFAQCLPRLERRQVIPVTEDSRFYSIDRLLQVAIDVSNRLSFPLIRFTT